MSAMSRDRLPDLRAGVTRKFKVPMLPRVAAPCAKCGEAPPPEDERHMKIYLTASTYESGKVGEIFIRADKVGSLASGAFDALAMCISVGLQYGVPLSAYTDKLKNTRFEPSGFTGDQEFPSCSSPLDLIARWLEKRFSDKEPTQ